MDRVVPVWIEYGSSMDRVLMYMCSASLQDQNRLSLLIVTHNILLVSDCQIDRSVVGAWHDQL